MTVKKNQTGMKLFKLSLILYLFVFQSCKESQEQTQNSQPKQITIYTIGDSTMANKPNPEENPERGWAQVLQQFFTEDVSISNHAVNGRSTRDFITEKRWDSIYNQLQKGDYVFIQFGHNDQKISKPNRYTNPYTAYRNNLIQFVNEAKSKGAFPVLFTSIVRRNFNEEGTLVDTHGAYPLVVRLVAQEYQIPLIDLQYLTEQLEESYGVEKSKKLHLHFEAEEHLYYPNGKQDNTHLSVLGATEIAKLAVAQLKKEVPSLGNYIIEN